MHSPSFRKILKTTLARCPECGRAIPGEVWKTTGSPAAVNLTRHCPEHGEITTTLASDARFYWLAQGNPANRCGSGCACSADPEGPAGTLGRNASAPGVVETLSTCLALIEIVDSCDLACPVCFADAPPGSAGERVLAHPLERLQARIRGVLERKGKMEILQLSGGEPTLHPEFFTLLDWIHEQPDIDYCLVNTNGVRLAANDGFLSEMGRRGRRGHLQLYLQYDGPGEAGQRELRGADLRALKLKAMRRCEDEGIPFTLAMTVTPDNLPDLWQTVETGLSFSACRGISFQPMFFSGRAPAPSGKRLNAADVILALLGQSGGKLGTADFTPLPCGDPNCAVIGYLLRTTAGVRSISEFIDFAAVQDFLRDKIRYQPADLARCGCENTELGEILHRLEMTEKDAFRLFVKPFMDTASWDQDRVDRCCTHVIRQDGSLASFCEYYLNGGCHGAVGPRV